MLEDTKLPNYLGQLNNEIYLYGISDVLKNVFSEIKNQKHIPKFKEEMGRRAKHIYNYMKGEYGVPLWYLEETLRVWERATGKSSEQLFNRLLELVQEFGLRRVRTRVKLPRFMFPDLAYLAGVIVGDGYIIANGNLVGVVNGDEKYLRDIVAPLFRKLFNFEVCIRRDPRKNHTYFLEAHSKVIVSFLISVFGFEKGKKAPLIPTIFKNYSRNILMEFITGFFDTDGSVSEKARTIKFTQKSKEFLIQIKEELANAHVRSFLYFDKRWDGWDVRVSNKDKKKFFTLICPRLQKKKVIAETVISGPVV